MNWLENMDPFSSTSWSPVAMLEVNFLAGGAVYFFLFFINLFM